MGREGRGRYGRRAGVDRREGEGSVSLVRVVFWVRA